MQILETKVTKRNDSALNRQRINQVDGNIVQVRLFVEKYKIICMDSSRSFHIRVIQKGREYFSNGNKHRYGHQSWT